ncbi:3-ketoacyl-ACP reductase [Pseudochrobactrum sp. sp1633]|uniref:3-ketoacyl-ACP reductase n=1 Tax=Pseudochrobactrum sp. sp1633 TaxID=3036706 RepID=UPI0025A5A325|nr:3-ketoacyl-ACP reductase [Pseudochrobactrum sp. sp1633]MDM8344059.1 3-ketoacyl-ACP reductase [Pseudochrobactrum sp. sp1633]HWD12032.1 3-ketoacyl-ACP reductase [Pseudochrobactrum sp.]
MTANKRPVALITGGRRGIGFGIAKALAQSGYDIAVTGLEAAVLDDAVIEELRATGAAAQYWQADLSDLTGHQATVEAVVGHFGSVDCLVNNAGIGSVVRGDFLDLSPENFDVIMNTNLRGTIFFTQAVVRAMLAVKNGSNARSVINITSVSATMSSPERLDYCVSKAGLSAFSQGLALRLASSGIAVFEVRPGIIHSDMTAKVSEKYDALIEGGLVPVKRWGEASDIGAICAHLASGTMGFATGSVISADGGLSIARL